MQQNVHVVDVAAAVVADVAVAADVVADDDDDDYDDDGGGDDDDAGDDDDDDRVGDDDDAFLSCDIHIVIPLRNRWARCPPPLIGKGRSRASLTPKPYIWLEEPVPV